MGESYLTRIKYIQDECINPLISSPQQRSWKDLKEYVNRNEPIKTAAVILTQLSGLRQQVLDLDAEQPGKVVDEGALHILQYLMSEIRNGNSSYLVRHSTELKRIFGGDCDQAKARKFFQVRIGEPSLISTIWHYKVFRNSSRWSPKLRMP